MRLFKRIALFLLVGILCFALYTVQSTGYFRNIEPHFDGKIISKINLTGAEDITLSESDSFVLVSATDRSLDLPDYVRGDLYLIDLTKEGFEPINLTKDFSNDFAPHGISMYKMDSSYLVMAISHPPNTHTIEVFELKNQQLSHLRTIQDEALVSPNDLVIINENQFYFTNDHGYTEGFGKMAEEYLGLALSDAVYFDGKQYIEVADDLAYANGINFDKNRNLVYIASARGFKVKVYDRNDDGTLNHQETIDCGTGVDNIELDANGHLWIGCHPNLLHFQAYRNGKKETSPSEILKIDYRSQYDYYIEQIYVEEGYDMSGSTVAAPFGNLIFTGNVEDDNFLVLERGL